MKRTLALALTVCLLSVTTAFAQGNNFKRIRFQGGTVQTTTKPDDWANELTVTSDEIVLKLKDGQVLKLNPNQVTALSYGQEANRLPLSGPMHNKRGHFIRVEYSEGDKQGSWLLLADKHNYRAVLFALKGSTGANVFVAPGERKYIPVPIETVDPSLIEEKKKKP
jgi:hypothetical protein